MTEDEFLELVRKHQDQIFRRAFYLLKNSEDAKDMVQETFIKTWQHRANLREDTVHSWMLKCVQNLCFNQLKRRKFQVYLDEEEDNTLEMLLYTHSDKSNPPPDEIAIKQELMQLVRQAIEELPSDMRSIVIMREFDEMSYKQIAEELKQPENSVKSTLFRARKKLREILGPFNGDRIMKPTIMILGSGHLANPGKDTFNVRMDDVLAHKRQNEIKQLVSQLKAFRPTKIGIQADERHDSEVNVNYQNYLEDTYQLARWEHDQIGFRLAKQMGHPKVYCVDFCPEYDPFFPEDLDPNLIDIDKFATENNQEHLLPKMEDFAIPEGKTYEEEDGRVWIEPKKYESIIDMYIRK